MTWWGATEHLSWKNGASKWSILVQKQQHNVQKPIKDESKGATHIYSLHSQLHHGLTDRRPIKCCKRSPQSHPRLEDSTTRVLSVMISDDLQWNHLVLTKTKKAAERLYFPRQLKRAGTESFVKSVPEYAYQSATVCLVSTTAIFRLPFAVNVMLYLLVIVSVYHFQKRRC